MHVWVKSMLKMWGAETGVSLPWWNPWCNYWRRSHLPLLHNSDVDSGGCLSESPLPMDSKGVLLTRPVVSTITYPAQFSLYLKPSFQRGVSARRHSALQSGAHKNVCFLLRGHPVCPCKHTSAFQASGSMHISSQEKVYGRSELFWSNHNVSSVLHSSVTSEGISM